jgi:hypothetical protein
MVRLYAAWPYSSRTAETVRIGRTFGLVPVGPLFSTDRLPFGFNGRTHVRLIFVIFWRVVSRVLAR